MTASLSLTATGSMSDSPDLISRIEAGDVAAFREIYDEHRQFVFRFIYAMVRDRDLTEELTQETFVRAFSSIRSMRRESSLATWLGGIARNAALSSFRSGRRDRLRVEIDDASIAELKAPERGPERALLDTELSNVIDSALAELSSERRMVFVLKVLEHLSYQEISEIMGHSIPKLKTDLHRARLEMRRIIGPYLETRS
jgi:RNA polymerase sigma-70 factor (ECF subfamily)